jgi:hypothetical protein
MRVLVLGCGPAGLLATHGAMHAGNQEVRVAILSRKAKSPLHGAQYLHGEIPYLTGDPVNINYRLDGDSMAYKIKVYGSMWDGTVSPEDLPDSHPGWDIREAYDRLWNMYHDMIVDQPISPASLRIMLAEDRPDLVINSIPRDALCYNPAHSFGAAEIWAAGDAPSLGIRVPYVCPENTVVCNGLEDGPSWYRLSRVFGHTTVEWPGYIERVPVTTASRWRKPTYTDCDCWPEIMHVGRYGSWKKGVLSHAAYWDAFAQVMNMTEGKGRASEEVQA